MKVHLIHRVVEAEELEDVCRQGWELEQVLVESKADKESECHPYIDKHGREASMYGDKVVQRTFNKFLVRQSGESAIEAMALELQQERLARNDARNKESVTKHELAMSEATLKKVRADNDSQHASLVRLGKEKVALQESNNKLEMDLATLRTALGALKMKEILGR